MEQPEALLHCFLDLGEAMLAAGADVNRVEDTLTRLGRAYGAVRMDVFVITSSIVVTMSLPDGRDVTQTRRILTPGGTDLTILEDLNALSRRYCTCPLTVKRLRAEITALRWDQVDFARNLLRLPGGEVSMGSRLRRMLSETLARRKDPAEERVFTSPATGRPMERAQLTAAARTALLRGGLEGVSLRDLCAEGRRADQSRMLAEQAAAQGWLERGDVMRLLGVSRTAARQQLLRLREAGVLVRVGERYYPAGAVTPPEEQLAVIQTYLREHGSGRRQDFLRLLNVSPAQGTQILRRLTARGELILTGRRYTLPKGK